MATGGVNPPPYDPLHPCRPPSSGLDCLNMDVVEPLYFPGESRCAAFWDDLAYRVHSASLPPPRFFCRN